MYMHVQEGVKKKVGWYSNLVLFVDCSYRVSSWIETSKSASTKLRGSEKGLIIN